MEKLDTDIIRLNDILGMIAEIEAFGAVDFTQRKEVFACAYAVAVIGEAAGRLSRDLCAKHPEIPWASITGMRHRIIHGYGTVNVDRLREVVNSYLPQLKQQVSAILEGMS